MAPAADKAGRVVFIGNIPYGVPEEEIQNLLSRVGNVVDFRIVTDRETGKPKGFGFAEFTEHDAAASAVRNLNDYEIQNRKLRVDWSNENGSGGDGNQPRPPAAVPVNGQGVLPPPSSGILPPLPPGIDLPPDISCPDQISKTLNTLPPAQLLDVLSQMKNLVKQDPVRATALLEQSPQLSYAIFQSLLLLGLVETSVLAQVIQAQPPAQPPQAAAVPPAHMSGYLQQPAPAPTPPIPQAYHPPPPPQAPPQPAVPGLDPKIFQQIMALTPEMIAALPAENQQQILQLRMQFGRPAPGF